MQFVVEGIRKVVVLVLLMELVLQLQSGKQYEPYIKMLVGIMVVYSLVSGIFGVIGNLGEGILAPMQEFQWAGNWEFEVEYQAEDETEINIAPVTDITIEEIKIHEIERIGGTP